MAIAEGRKVNESVFPFNVGERCSHTEFIQSAADEGMVAFKMFSSGPKEGYFNSNLKSVFVIL